MFVLLLWIVVCFPMHLLQEFNSSSDIGSVGVVKEDREPEIKQAGCTTSVFLNKSYFKKFAKKSSGKSLNAGNVLLCWC